MMDRKYIIRGIERCSRCVDDLEADQILFYLKELWKWKGVTNITGYRNLKEAFEKGVVPAIHLMDHIKGSEIMDVGSGCGLPGIPLAIMLPGVRVTLVESSKKRASFLWRVKTIIPAGERLNILNVRIEDLSGNYRESLETVVSRGVAKPWLLFDKVSPYITKRGRCLIITSEILSKRAEEILAGSDVKVETISVTIPSSPGNIGITIIDKGG